MLLSVVIPVLNAKDYISECLDCVLTQTIKNIEVICIDGGSTDGTKEILLGYANDDSRVRIIDSSIKSEGYQFNLGIDASCGEYIGFVEADDVIASDMYESLLDEALKYDADYVKEAYFTMSTCTGKRLVVKNNRPRIYGLEDKLLPRDDKYLLLDTSHVWSGIYSKDFLNENEIRFNETLGASYQDTGFSVLTDLLAKRAVYSNKAHYYYRIDVENSSSKDDKKYLCVVDEFDYIREQLKKRNIYDRYRFIIQKLKIRVYYWNYNRLSIPYRKLFIEKVKGEFDEIFNVRNELCLEQDEVDMLDIMYNDKSNRFIIEEQQKFDSIVAYLKCREKIVVFGAGCIGQELLVLAEALNIKSIECVVDNDSQKWGNVIEGYIVKEPNDVLKNKEKYSYCIANYLDADRIKKQLIEKGVTKDRIYHVSSVPSLSSTITYYRSNNKVEKNKE